MGCKKLTYHETLSPLKVVCSNLNISGISCVGSYRYGFQGQEMDDEVKGEGNSVNYKYRMHDPRVGRFFATDPYEASYTSLSTYSFVGNNPITNIEVDGGWWFERGGNKGPYYNPTNSEYSYKMSNVRSVASKSTGLLSNLPIIGNIYGGSVIGQKMEDPTMKVGKEDVLGLILTAHFKGTRRVIKALGALNKPARIALGVSERITNLAANIASNPDLTESYIELEVMRYFDGITSESGNSIGKLSGDNDEGFTTTFHFSKEYVSELETEFGDQFDKGANYFMGGSEIQDSKVYDAIRSRFIKSSVESHLKEKFENKKKEITKELENAIDKYEEE